MEMGINTRAYPRPPEIVSSRSSDAAHEIRFHAAFESGNLGEVVRLSAVEYELRIRPDTHNPRHRVWWHFRARAARSGHRVIFHIVNQSKTRSSYRDGMAPVVRSRRRPSWVRMPFIHEKNHLYPWLTTRTHS